MAVGQNSHIGASFRALCRMIILDDSLSKKHQRGEHGIQKGVKMEDDREKVIPAIKDAAADRQGPSAGSSQPAAQHSIRLWVLFLAAIVLSFFVHELGHCAVSWIHGYRAVPTPAKEYVLESIPESVQHQVALGGLVGSVLALLVVMFWLNLRPSASASALLAGGMTAPGFYTLRFILAGRGHDATEFQEAQAALGLSYSGHAADWLWVGLFMIATLFWFVRTRARLTPRLLGRFVVGSLVAMLTVVLLQFVNNAVFDPLFEPKSKAVALYDAARVAFALSKAAAAWF
jgi:hypothetical protein